MTRAAPLITIAAQRAARRERLNSIGAAMLIFGTIILAFWAGYEIGYHYGVLDAVRGGR